MVWIRDFSNDLMKEKIEKSQKEQGKFCEISRENIIDEYFQLSLLRLSDKIFLKKKSPSTNIVERFCL